MNLEELVLSLDKKLQSDILDGEPDANGNATLLLRGGLDGEIVRDLLEENPPSLYDNREAVEDAAFDYAEDIAENQMKGDIKVLVAAGVPAENIEILFCEYEDGLDSFEYGIQVKVV